MKLELYAAEGVLYREKLGEGGEKELQLVAPFSIRRTIFEQLHGGILGGHLGMTRTLEQVSRRFYWPGCRTDLRQWGKECPACAQVKPGPRQRAQLTPMTVGAPMDRVALDIVGELPETSSGNKFILVLSDYFTKWVEAYALPDQTALTVADVVVREFFSRYGVCRTLHSDQGTNFQSELFQEMCKLLGVKKTRTVPYNPKGDGLVERFNRTLLQMLKTVVNEERNDWDEHLPYVVAAYRQTRHESTGYTPFFLMYGRQALVPLDIQVGLPKEQFYQCSSEYGVWLRQTLEHAYQLARNHLRAAAERQKNKYDARMHPYHYQVGQYVWRYYPPKAKKKLGRGWIGPFKIVGVPSRSNCVIQRHPKGPTQRVHCDALKLYHGKTPRGWGGEDVNEDRALGEIESEPQEELSEQEEIEKMESAEEEEDKVDEQAETVSSGNENCQTPPLSRTRGRRMIKPPNRLDL